MCVVCGCAAPREVRHEGEGPYRAVRRPLLQRGGHQHPHHEPAAPAPARDSHVRVDADSGDLHYGAGAACASVPGISQARAVRLELDVLGENARHAQRNRERFARQKVLALNLVSSPGSGKTTLLCATIAALRQRGRGAPLPVAVIEGDQQTSNDAERIRATGAPAIQVNTGKGCHLDAQMVGDACQGLPSVDGGVLFIENVGNLVCPAMWDLGEAAKVAILSVTEGEDKPLKYPDMFAAASLMILNKVDLLPYLQFDVERCLAYARRVNPAIRIIELSATSGAGMDAWLDWIDGARAA